jgi:hypothetical protein
VVVTVGIAGSGETVGSVGVGIIVGQPAGAAAVVNEYTLLHVSILLAVEHATK